MGQPIRREDVPSFFQTALQKFATGRLADAQAIFARLADAFPNLAEAHFRLGQVERKLGNTSKAFRAYYRALDLKPAELAIWQAAIEHACQSGSTRDQKRLKKALKTAPLSESQKALMAAWLERWLSPALPEPAKMIEREDRKLQALLSEKQFSKAATQASKAIRVYPMVASLLCHLAVAEAAMGHTQEADVAFQLALDSRVVPPQVYVTYADFLLDRGLGERAVPVLRNAIKRSVDSTELKISLGMAYVRTKDFASAQALMEEIGEANSARAEYVIGQMHLANRKSDAIGHFERAIALGYDTPETYLALAQACEDRNYDDQVRATYQAGLKRHPGNLHLIAESALFDKKSGNVARAKDVVSDVLKQQPSNSTFNLIYSSLGKMQSDDPVVAVMRARYKSQSLHPQERLRLAFALSKVSLDVGNNEDVFPYLNTANELSRQTYPYAIESDRAFAQKVQKFFKHGGVLGEGHADAKPIFVTGLPRSGTSLVEQILATHGQAEGAGEVGMIGRKVKALMDGEAEAGTPKEIGKNYWDFLKRRYPDAERIVDKSITSYAYIGLLAQIFPQARFIVTRRDPLDNAFSIYRNTFVEGRHRYSNDLADIAHFTRLFEAQVAHWQKVLPGRFYELRYEDLVEDFEPQAKALVAASGLDWDPNCLNFHENDRRVDTLSTLQVRQPIYASSIGAGRKFKDEMSEFVDTYDRLG